MRQGIRDHLSPQRAQPRDPRQHRQQIRATNFTNGALAQRGQHILVKDPPNLRQRALPAFLEGERPVLDPVVERTLKRVFFCLPVGFTGVPAMRLGIDPLRQSFARFVPMGTRVTQTDLRIGAQRHRLLLPAPALTEMPRPPSRGRHCQGQAVNITEGVVFAGGLGLPDGSI